MVDVTNIPPLTEAEAEELFALPTMRQDAWEAIESVPHVYRTTITAYVEKLEAQLREARDEVSRFRYPDTTGQ